SAVEWSFNERDGTFWLDNVTLHEAEATERDPSLFRLEYNRTAEARTVPLTEPWVDMLGRTYEGALTLAPGASIVLLRKEACR
ncbi:MAG TPA: hypothetical protein VEJ18_18960, partial [Planctomycetota bacterium]|nr:hypothetical protein [Planctomycetota bacterium]